MDKIQNRLNWLTGCIKYYTTTYNNIISLEFVIVYFFQVLLKNSFMIMIRAKQKIFLFLEKLFT